jgi:hypothetical protein
MHNALEAFFQRLKIIMKLCQLPVDQLPFYADRFIRGLNAENNLKYRDIVIMKSKWKNSQPKISSKQNASESVSSVPLGLNIIII